jgi:hypothetical protein
MGFSLLYSAEANETLDRLEAENSVKSRKVIKALALMEANIKHPGLHTHVFDARTGQNGEKVFEAYVENHTPGAYRIYWHYGPERGVITVLAITPHP